MKKIIITFLLLFLFFGIKEEVLAAFKEDGKPTLISPGDTTTGVSLGPEFQWWVYTDGSSYKIIISGPGKKIEDCISVNPPCSKCYKYPGSTGGGPTAAGYMEYQVPAGTLFNSYQKGCKYSWKVQAFEGNNCEIIHTDPSSDEHSQWSDIWRFTTIPSLNPAEKCPPVPGVAKYGKPIECCKLKYSFTDVDEKCEKGTVVGSGEAGAWCDWNNDGTEDILDDDEKIIRWGTCCFLNSLYNLADWLAMIIIPLSILVFLAAGYHFLTSGGDPNKVKTAQGLIFWGLIGVLITGLAKAIVAIIKVAIG